MTDEKELRYRVTYLFRWDSDPCYYMLRGKGESLMQCDVNEKDSENVFTNMPYTLTSEQHRY